MKTISTEELRKQLENYSPESKMNKQRQEQEQRDATFVKDIATLSELSQTIETSTDRLTRLAAELNATHFAVTLPDEFKADLRQCCEEAANTAAETFKAKARPLLKEMEKAEHRVPLPATASYTILLIFFWLAIFFVIVVYANCQLWHSADLWKIVWATLFGAVTSAALVIFLTQKSLVVRELYVSKPMARSTSSSLTPLSGFVQTTCGI